MITPELYQQAQEVIGNQQAIDQANRLLPDGDMFIITQTFIAYPETHGQGIALWLTAAACLSFNNVLDPDKEQMIQEAVNTVAEPADHDWVGFYLPHAISLFREGSTQMAEYEQTLTRAMEIAEKLRGLMGSLADSLYPLLNNDEHSH